MSRTAVLSVLAALAAFLLLWQLVVIVSGFPPFILPPPGSVMTRWVAAWTAGTIQPHLGATLVEIALGFALGAGSALVAGYALARSALVERLASPYLVAAQATPILALAPLIALWFGPGLVGKVVICALIVFFPVAVATMVGIRSVDARLLELGRSLRASPRQILTTLAGPFAGFALGGAALAGFDAFAGFGFAAAFAVFAGLEDAFAFAVFAAFGAGFFD